MLTLRRVCLSCSRLRPHRRGVRSRAWCCCPFAEFSARLQSADDAKPVRASPSRRATTSASSATRWPTACSTTAGWKRYLHSRFPKHDLVFRNLGFSGDELTMRLRSADFGTPGRVADASARPTWSSPSSATTSRSPARRGSTSSRRTSTTFIKHTLGAEVQRQERRRGWCCSRRSRTRTCTTRNLPDGTENNERLELYTAAMAEVAKANGVPFVDLFQPDAGAVRQARREPLTINGIHLNEQGNELVARVDRSARCSAQPSRARRRPQLRASSARPSSTRTSTGSTAIARSMATRSTAAGPT